MPVFQIEEYYLDVSIKKGYKSKIEDLLSKEGFMDYEFQDDDTQLIVENCFEYQDLEQLELKIDRLMSKG
jgi:hypothetical protein